MMPLPLTLHTLNEVSARSITLAGPRYTPGLDPSAPNLVIENLSTALDAAAHSNTIRTHLESLVDVFKSAWKEAPKAIKSQFDHEKIKPDALCRQFYKLARSAPGVSPSRLNQLQQRALSVRKTLSGYTSKLYQERSEHRGDQKVADDLSRKLYEATKVSDAFDGLETFVRSPAFLLLQRNLLLIHGGWGAGKTHLLCDLAKSFRARDLPALLLLGQSLRRGINPLEAVAETLGPISEEDLLKQLDQIGRARGCRTLLIIDGINEGDRDAWAAHAARIARSVSSYKNIALILSCRTPFEQQIFAESTAKRFVHISHNGFSDIEFDAQKEFFRYYDIPTPHIPLLAPEFTKPLFLKILCESIATLGRTAKRQRITEFASGHKGMTKLLEDFVRHIGRPIEQEFEIPHLSCWKILKGTGDSESAVGLAPRMAETGTDYVSHDDCVSILAEVAKISSADKAESLLARMINDGLLIEDNVYIGKRVTVVRLPYQRFSDHLISRHLLARYLNVASESAVRRSFYSNRPLGRIFEVDEWSGEFKWPNLVSALMLEFPERTKRKKDLAGRELFYFLPARTRTNALIDPFIDGLTWRSSETFSEQTERVINALLLGRDREIAGDVLEALVCLASRHTHPLNADSLLGRLKSLDVPTLDLLWSEFLRNGTEDSAAYRVLDWIERGDTGQLQPAVVQNLVKLCSLFLTSTVRRFRDRATKSLVLLGDHHPDVLMSWAVQALDFADPYVGERVLAAAYGSMMRRWAFGDIKLVSAAEELGLVLARRLKGTKRVPPIEHILVRDYAAGLVSLASLLCPSTKALRVPTRSRVSRASLFPAPEDIDPKVVESAKPAIHMDFGNYTIGRIIPSRSDYDYENEDYKTVLKQISWRICDFGYDAQRFKSADAEISTRNYHLGRSDDGTKIDRYGKKYSWIAYYEIAGRRDLEGKLTDSYDARISEADLDPSFPDAPVRWKPETLPIFDFAPSKPWEWTGSGPSPDYRHLLTTNDIDGVVGPWVLLNGYVSEHADNDDREVFTFLRGLLVRPENVDKLERLVSEIEYPGNSVIPDIPSQYYLFAGEIGWSPKFGVDFRNRRGRVRPYLAFALDQRKETSVRKKLSELAPFELIHLRPELLERLDSSLQSDPDPVVSVKRWLRVPGVEVEIPAWRFGWESYHSVENDGGTPNYPSPMIVESLGLRKRGGAVDLVDSRGQAAMACREYTDDKKEFRSNLLYLRSDLLNAYLKRRCLSLVWINWGERQIHYNTAERYRENPEMRRVWSGHAHIHKQFVRYAASNAAAG